MANNISAQIAQSLQGLSPSEIRRYLSQIRADAVAQAADEQESQAASQAEIKNVSADELTSELENYDPRTADPKRYRQVKTELRQKQKAAAVEAAKTTMPRAEWIEQELKRIKLVEEADILRGQKSVTPGGRPSAARKRLREIGQELKAMPPPPDRIVEPPPKVEADG